VQRRNKILKKEGDEVGGSADFRKFKEKKTARATMKKVIKSVIYVESIP